MLDPVQRRRYGVTALALSAVFIGLSVAGGAATAMRRDAVVEEISASEAKCQQSITALGASSVQVSGDNLTAEWVGVDGGYSAMGTASAAAMSCPGWKMKAFCMGQECANAGVTLQMSRAIEED